MYAREGQHVHESIIGIVCSKNGMLEVVKDRSFRFAVKNYIHFETPHFVPMWTGKALQVAQAYAFTLVLVQGASGGVPDTASCVDTRYLVPSAQETSLREV